MSYQNPYLNPYGFANYGQYMPPMQNQNQQQVTRVSGENGAKAYQIGANSSALLLDESGLMVWLCTTDGAGYKTVTAYDISPHKSEPAPNFNDLESRIVRLEEIVNANSSNTSTVRKKSVKSDDESD